MPQIAGVVPGCRDPAGPQAGGRANISVVELLVSHVFCGSTVDIGKDSKLTCPFNASAEAGAGKIDHNYFGLPMMQSSMKGPRMRKKIGLMHRMMWYEQIQNFL